VPGARSSASPQGLPGSVGFLQKPFFESSLLKLIKELQNQL
jgi:hypothetical protein